MKVTRRSTHCPWQSIATTLLMWMMVALAHAGTVTYVYANPQGTPLAEADAQRNITARFDYRPYGSIALGTAPNGPGYTGHVNDPDTGLVYMQARYYDPDIGRFASTDPVASTPSNLSNFNRYVYAGNNPIVNIDPDGRQTNPATDPPELQYKDNVPPASGRLEAMLSCTQQCSGQSLVVTSTHEAIPQHPSNSPHGRGEAADLRVASGTERQVLQCASNCGARFGLDEAAHPSAHATGPHVHVQIVPGTHGGRGDLPRPQQNQPQFNPPQPPSATSRSSRQEDQASEN